LSLLSFPRLLGIGRAYSLEGLTDDTQAAVEWVMKQPSVDEDRIVLLGASTGSYPALRCGVRDPRVRAIVGISPLIEPRAFQFPKEMAGEFAGMLNGVTDHELLRQWESLPPLSDSIAAFAPRPVLLVTAGKDSIFPFSDYRDSIARFRSIRCVQNEESDHSFSSCRPWLVRTVTDWLTATIGR
jgi:pimeloyl-ACP methyl ester carboxylesterase